MIHEVISPCEALKDLISHFWVGTWDTTSQKPHTTYYVVANSLTEITFAFNGNHPAADLLFSAVQGHTHRPNQFTVDGFYHLIGVSFYSHAIPRLFNIPASELNHAFISLDTFLGQEGVILNEKIALAQNTPQRIELLSACFMTMLKKPQLEDPLISRAIKAIRSSNGKTKIEDLANTFCLSQKQFNRRFKAFSGFNPKTYSRIIRFESVIQTYPHTANLTETAYAHDYYDQAHFIHEFKSFTGFAPGDFWKLGEAQH